MAARFPTTRWSRVARADDSSRPRSSRQTGRRRRDRVDQPLRRRGPLSERSVGQRLAAHSGTEITNGTIDRYRLGRSRLESG
jgi:hypothetical protein